MLTPYNVSGRKKMIEIFYKSKYLMSEQNFSEDGNYVWFTLVNVHTACRKNYTKLGSIDGALNMLKNEPTPSIW